MDLADLKKLRADPVALAQITSGHAPVPPSTQHDQRVTMPGTRDLAGSWLRPSRMFCVQITV